LNGRRQRDLALTGWSSASGSGLRRTTTSKEEEIVRIKAASVNVDASALLVSEAAEAAIQEIRAELAVPTIVAARWLLLAHRPLPDAPDRYVPTYTVNLAVDGLGIMPEDYLGHDGDPIPEFDLRTLLEHVQGRAKGCDWQARVEVSYSLRAGMLFEVNLRLPDDLPSEWSATIEEPPAGEAVRSVDDLRRVARLRRKINLAATFTSPEQIPAAEVKGRLSVLTTALADTPLEIEAGWSVGVCLSRYEWEN